MIILVSRSMYHPHCVNALFRFELPVFTIAGSTPYSFETSSLLFDPLLKRSALADHHFLSTYTLIVVVFSSALVYELQRSCPLYFWFLSQSKWILLPNYPTIVSFGPRSSRLTWIYNHLLNLHSYSLNFVRFLTSRAYRLASSPQNLEHDVPYPILC